MKPEEIFKQWEVDSTIDPTNITGEHLKIPKYHHKYLQFLLHERQVLRALEYKYRLLYRDKYEFYDQGPSKETQLKWADAVLPSKGAASTKKELEMYIDADKDIISAAIKIGDQKEKIELLESIINMINNRSYHLQNIVKWEKFRAGD